MLRVIQLLDHYRIELGGAAYSVPMNRFNEEEAKKAAKFLSEETKKQISANQIMNEVLRL